MKRVTDVTIGKPVMLIVIIVIIMIIVPPSGFQNREVYKINSIRQGSYKPPWLQF